MVNYSFSGERFKRQTHSTAGKWTANGERLGSCLGRMGSGRARVPTVPVRTALFELVKLRSSVTSVARELAPVTAAGQARASCLWETEQRGLGWWGGHTPEPGVGKTRRRQIPVFWDWEPGRPPGRTA